MAALNSMKVLLGNLQIISSIRDIMGLAWPQWLIDIMDTAKLFAGGFLEMFNFQCVLGQYSYETKFYVTILVPVISVATIAMITLAKIELSRANAVLGEHDFSASKVKTRAITAGSVLVFLL